MFLPLPLGAVAHAIAHGLGACAIVVAIALLWTLLPGGRDAEFALATVTTIGCSAWIGATAAARSRRRSRPASNDNHPPDPIGLVWSPIADRAATVHTHLG